MELKIILFIMGTLILIITTFIFGYVISKFSNDIEKADEEISFVEKKVNEKEFQVRDFQIAESEGLGVRNTIAILEGMQMKDTPQYKNLARDLQIIKVNSLIYLAAAADVNVSDELTKRWSILNFNQLEEEKLKYAKNLMKPLNLLLSEKKKMENKKQKMRLQLTRLSLYGAMAQTIGLLMLGISEVLYKIK